MFFYLTLGILGLPLFIWFFCMVLYVALPHVVFWLLVVGLAVLVGRMVMRAGQS